jgi:chromate transport protein ChrA
VSAITSVCRVALDQTRARQDGEPPGWVGNDAFLAGYGAAQAVPGPLFTFAAYLGTVMGPAPYGWVGGLICVAAIYLPSFLLLVGVLPFCDTLRRRTAMRSALAGVNAAVVGLLPAALYTPVWSSAIFAPADFGIGILAFLLLVMWRVPPWLVVILGALVRERRDCMMALAGWPSAACATSIGFRRSLARRKRPATPAFRPIS